MYDGTATRFVCHMNVTAPVSVVPGEETDWISFSVDAIKDPGRVAVPSYEGPGTGAVITNSDEQDSFSVLTAVGDENKRPLRDRTVEFKGGIAQGFAKWICKATADPHALNPQRQLAVNVTATDAKNNVAGGSDNYVNFQYPPKAGACASCGAVAAAGAKFCSQCGTALPAS